MTDKTLTKLDYISVTQCRVSFPKQELHILRDHLGSRTAFSLSVLLIFLVFCVVFCGFFVFFFLFFVFILVLCVQYFQGLWILCSWMALRFSQVYFNGGVYNRLQKRIDIMHAMSLMLTISIHLHNVLKSL